MFCLNFGKGLLKWNSFTTGAEMSPLSHWTARWKIDNRLTQTARSLQQWMKRYRCHKWECEMVSASRVLFPHPYFLSGMIQNPRLCLVHRSDLIEVLKCLVNLWPWAGSISVLNSARKYVQLHCVTTVLWQLTSHVHDCDRTTGSIQVCGELTRFWGQLKVQYHLKGRKSTFLNLAF